MSSFATRSARRRPVALRLESLDDRLVPATAVGVSFAGAASSLISPPDTSGAVGPGHYVQFTNGRFAVYTKTGTLVGTPKTDRAFWNAALPAGSGASAVGHPRILYDPLSDRWFAAAVTTDVDRDNRVLVGRSNTNNPAGGWRAASFPTTDPNRFADRPTLGLDADGVYVGTTDSVPEVVGYLETTFTSIPKVDLLLATPTTARRTTSDPYQFPPAHVLQGVTNFGPDPDHGSFVLGDLFNTGIVHRATITGAGGPGATFGPMSSYQGQATESPNLAHQPDGTATIDPVDASFSGSVWQVGDLIVGVRSIQVNGWNAVRLTVLSDSQDRIVTEATWARTGFDYIDPSVAMNPQGDILIGFTRSRSTLGSGVNDGRLGAYAVSAYLDPTDPTAGVTFGSEIQLRAGGTIKYHMTNDFREPWGMYSATGVDPTDPTAFWTTQEFASGARSWGTRVAQVVFSPRVTGVTSPTADGTYGVGVVIPVTVTFNAPVVVTGSPWLMLNAAAGAAATYAGGSGTNTLTFNYTVGATDQSADLDGVSPDALELNGGTIKLKHTKVSLAAITTLPEPGDPGSLGANKNIVIDTTPRVSGGVSSPLANGTYQTANVLPITVTFNYAVAVTGTPQLALNSGAGAVATYASGGGTAVLTFNYLVLDGHAATDLDYTSTTALVLNGGTIRNHLGGAPADLTLPAPGAAGSLGANKDFAIDTRSPIVTGVATTLANGSYGFGQVIPLTVTFNKPVDVTGAPKLALNSGGTADYVGGTGSAVLSFTYTVGGGHYAPDLDAASPTALTVVGATITDVATGVDATLTLPVAPAAGSLGGSKDIAVDARPAELADVNSTHPNGAYPAGTVIPITVTFSKQVDVTGGPTLALNSGGTATYTGTDGTFTELTFAYTVATGQNTEDLDAASPSALALNGGSILRPRVRHARPTGRPGRCVRRAVTGGSQGDRHRHDRPDGGRVSRSLRQSLV